MDAGCAATWREARRKKNRFVADGRKDREELKAMALDHVAATE